MKPQAELAVSSGATQNDRATFERKEANWREELENKAAKIKDPQTTRVPHEIDMVASHRCARRTAPGL